ncbi:3D-(3,5/4)-trihydroxycyclohexane-1,2-dione acylhydrolase (decyclizing) [Shewanella surugensis]|uniref:3D-(3,5/4)-trihydroxycyclohexane-1,2-dione acylhydrolase (Decyclizing) n=1 Tax=Shewanella surugensis TaxID=212020 RepID=A0ABT0LJ42_9GAMM|nr:3D-(3,5/4)-trihydroxycyclohexane-1,2-dione acylhydrolase (decyclizing) [Shewanella surugensis]MCL1127317.1 3D-(3,5/4)-trihydroxycyclohexane-1,2-dione acylhydrolase (decyclizing) [Shewanella surugensis]
MSTTKLTMAQALLKFLANQYIEMDSVEHKLVDSMFGIFGHGNVTGLGEALEYDNFGIKLYQGHNEQGMAHAATAYAKQKNRLGIIPCTSSIGPGATNMVTAAATATTNRIPLLLLPGDIFACRQPDPVLQQIENASDLTISANDVFKPVSKYWDRISRPEQLMSACLSAFRVLTDPAETGAVTLCLPQDVQAESYDYPDSFFAKRVWHLDRFNIPERALQAAITVIQNAKQPLIIAGGGVHYSYATESLQQFAEKHHIPVCETQAGKSALAWDHKLNVGALGVTGGKAANVLAANADVILSIGTRLQDFTTASKSVFQNVKVKLIHLNINAFDGLKMEGCLLKADTKAGLAQLTQGLKSFKTETHYQQHVEHLRLEWNREVDRLYYAMQGNDGLNQTAVMGVVNDFLSEDDVIICAAGSIPGDLHRLWRSKKAKDYHVEYANSCMGYEVAAGLGVKLALNAGEPYVIVGDGSFIMMHSELLTAIQEQQKINIILLDNSGFQCIRNLQESCGSQTFGTEFRFRDKTSGKLNGKNIPIDFAQYAGALGATTFKADSLDSLKIALQAAKKAEGSTLIEMKVDPKTMSGGYDSWWRVGVAEVSKSEAVIQANSNMATNINHAKKY